MALGFRGEEIRRARVGRADELDALLVRRGSLGEVARVLELLRLVCVGWMDTRGMDAGSVWSAARGCAGAIARVLGGSGSGGGSENRRLFYREGRQRAGRGRTLEFDGALREDGVVVVEDLLLGLSHFGGCFCGGRVGDGAGPSSAAP